MEVFRVVIFVFTWVVIAFSIIVLILHHKQMKIEDEENRKEQVRFNKFLQSLKEFSKDLEQLMKNNQV